MSSIPNSAIPHAVDPELAQAYEQRQRRRPLAKVVRLLAAPPLVALGLGVMAIERLRDRPAPAPA